MKIRKSIKAPFLLALLLGFLLLAGCAEITDFVTFVETWETAGMPEETRATLETSSEENSLEERFSEENSSEESIESMTSEEDQPPETQPPETEFSVKEEETYSTRDEVALYLHLYGHLPANYITKKEARERGWDNSAGNLWEVADGLSIGGDRFGNYEGLLPEAEGRVWRECDVGYEGGYRGAQRILYSSDGLIYYTEDHYQSFTCLYDGP